MTIPADALKGANAGRSRGLNRRIVLGKVRDAGRIGRAQIARATGLSTQAVSNIIAELESEDLLLQDGRTATGRGLPALLYALNPTGGYAVGIEIRPDALFLSVMNLVGEEVAAHRERLESNDPDHVTTRITALRSEVLRRKRIPARKVLGFGIVLPGPFGTTGLSDAASELPGWQQLDVGPWFSKRLGTRVLVENDANAAAMAERVSGIARTLDSFAYIYFGAGLGLGLVQNGQLVRGAHGNAGEIGHTIVPGPDGPVMLEQALSRVAVQRHLSKYGIDATSSQDLERLFEAQEPALLDWLAAASEPLSHAVSMVENMFDPQSIILGGAMPANVLEHLIAQVSLSVRSVANRSDRVAPRLQCGGNGRMTAARGAAALMIDRSFLPVIATTE